MKLYIDRGTKRLSAVAQGAEEVQTLKGGQSEPLRLTFLTDANGTPAGLADGSTILVTIKETKEATTILASTGTFTKTGTEHLGWIDLDNDAVNALEDGDEALVEVKWTETGHTERSDDLVIKISKLLSDGTEDVPIDGSDAVISDFLFARITSTDESVTITQTDTGIDLAAEGGPGGATDWGDIGGTLSAQTDLQAALDAKSGTGHTHTGLSVQAAGTPSVRALGTGATEAAAGNDARLTDSRTPTAHASSHVTGGADKIRDATASVDGLMTAAFAAKLDGLSKASQAEAEAGTDNVKYMTPLATSQAITALGGSGGGIDTIAKDASEIIPRVTNGCGMDSSESTTHKVNIDWADFDATAAEYGHVWFTWPSGWTTAKVSVQWSATSGSGSAVFRAAMRCYADGDTLDAAPGTAQSVTDAAGTANTYRMTADTPGITPAGTVAAGARTLLELSRDATNGSDDLAVDARVMAILISKAT